MRITPGIALSLAILLAILAPATIAAAAVLLGRPAVLAGSGTAGTLDGTGAAARFDLPSDVALNASGTLAAVIDTTSGRVRRVSPATAAVTTLPAPPAGGGECGQSRLLEPGGISVSADGTFALVANSSCNTIVRVNLASGAHSTLAGGPSLIGGAQDGAGAAARFASPTDVTLSPDGRYALVADGLNRTIRRIDMATGAVSTLAGAAGQRGRADGVGAAARFLGPRQIAISPDGTFALISDVDTVGSVSTLRRLTLSTGQVRTVAGPSSGEGCDGGPRGAARHGWFRGVALSPGGAYALLTDDTCNTIWRFDLASGALQPVARDINAGGVALSGPRSAIIAGLGDHLVRRLELVELTESVSLPLLSRGP